MAADRVSWRESQPKEAVDLWASECARAVDRWLQSHRGASQVVAGIDSRVTTNLLPHD
jgi:hypothetical protein